MAALAHPELVEEEKEGKGGEGKEKREEKEDKEEKKDEEEGEEKEEKGEREEKIESEVKEVKEEKEAKERKEGREEEPEKKKDEVKKEEKNEYDKDDISRYTLTPEDKELTRQKIRAILNIGIDNGTFLPKKNEWINSVLIKNYSHSKKKKGHDAIVLSAFGCGAFRNPPGTMAKLFYEIITNEFAGGKVGLPKTYRHIGFAIFDDESVWKRKGGEGNVTPFKRLFDNFEWKS